MSTLNEKQWQPSSSLVCTGMRQAATRREDLARLTEELQRARREATSATNAWGAPLASTSAGQRDTRVADVAEGKQSSKTDTQNAATAAADGVNSRDGGLGDSKDPATGAVDVDTAAAALGEEEEAGGASGRARSEARRARDDAKVAEEALRLLRLEVEELARGWTDERMRLLGELERRGVWGRDGGMEYEVVGASERMDAGSGGIIGKEMRQGMGQEGGGGGTKFDQGCCSGCVSQHTRFVVGLGQKCVVLTLNPT